MAFMKKVDKTKEELREKFIAGGGLVAADVQQEEKKEEWIHINLRIRKDAVEQIDKLTKKRMGMTRTGWILESIEEKLRRSEFFGRME